MPGKGPKPETPRRMPGRAILLWLGLFLLTFAVYNYWIVQRNAPQEISYSRFQQEVAFWVERTDITEEMVRAESHLKQFRSMFGGQDPVGRKMDFLLQEIHREANTISSKANDAEISQKVVEIKSELEKIREQIQNIE